MGGFHPYEFVITPDYQYVTISLFTKSIAPEVIPAGQCREFGAGNEVHFDGAKVRELAEIRVIGDIPVDFADGEKFANACCKAWSHILGADNKAKFILLLQFADFIARGSDSLNFTVEFTDSNIVYPLCVCCPPLMADSNIPSEALIDCVHI